MISTSIADIFFSNALKNGLVPVRIDAATHAWLLANPGRRDRDGRPEAGCGPGGGGVFAIDPFARHCLLNGVDELGYLFRVPASRPGSRFASEPPGARACPTWESWLGYPRANWESYEQVSGLAAGGPFPRRRHAGTYGRFNDGVYLRRASSSRSPLSGRRSSPTAASRRTTTRARFLHRHDRPVRRALHGDKDIGCEATPPPPCDWFRDTGFPRFFQSACRMPRCSRRGGHIAASRLDRVPRAEMLAARLSVKDSYDIQRNDSWRGMAVVAHGKHYYLLQTELRSRSSPPDWSYDAEARLERVRAGARGALRSHRVPEAVIRERTRR